MTGGDASQKMIIDVHHLCQFGLITVVMTVEYLIETDLHGAPCTCDAQHLLSVGVHCVTFGGYIALISIERSDAMKLWGDDEQPRHHTLKFYVCLHAIALETHLESL